MVVEEETAHAIPVNPIAEGTARAVLQNFPHPLCFHCLAAEQGIKEHAAADHVKLDAPASLGGLITGAVPSLAVTPAGFASVTSSDGWGLHLPFEGDALRS